MSDDEFFVGYAETPPTDRRFFLRAGLGLMVGTGLVGVSLAGLQRAPGPGTWNQGEIREFVGIATAEPYAMLRTADVDGAPKTVLLSCLGKCGVSARIGALADQPVTVKGSLIQRGPHAMIAVVDGMDWIAPAEARFTSDMSFPESEPLGEIDLAGEILDSKCWFGAMRPSEGKVHKSCAALCIRGGLPPALYARDRAGRGALMIMTDRGGPHGEALLPLVADPVRVRGALRRAGDLYYVDAPVAQIARI